MKQTAPGEPDPDAVTSVDALADAYLAAISSGDLQAILALYAADPTVEDPVGSDPRVGAAAVRAFYERAMRTPMKAARTGPVAVAAGALAFPFRLELRGGAMVIDVIDVFDLDDQGRISRMRAYWGPRNMRRGDA